MYDDDDGGTISYENLKKVADDIRREGMPDVPDSHLHGMIRMADKTFNGEEVNKEDFMALMRETNQYSEIPEDF